MLPKTLIPYSTSLPNQVLLYYRFHDTSRHCLFTTWEAVLEGSGLFLEAFGGYFRHFEWGTPQQNSAKTIFGVGLFQGPFFSTLKTALERFRDHVEPILVSLRGPPMFPKPLIPYSTSLKN